MSQENIQVVRRMVDAFNSGDLRRAAPHFHPDVEFTSGFTERKTYVGVDGLGQYADDLEAVWENCVRPSTPRAWCSRRCRRRTWN
jgi:ketosteroid isomerase-like protein